MNNPGIQRSGTGNPIRLDEPLTSSTGAHFEAVARIQSVQSPFQLIEVFATPALGTLMRLDGCNMLSERDEFFYHENVIHPAAIAHANPTKALIIGGGDGGSAEELLKHPSIKSVVLCELDQAVIAVAKEHFQSVHHNVFSDSRLSVHIADGHKYVQRCDTDDGAELFDLIYLDLTDPTGDAEALYTEAFYADCKRILQTGGALTLHIGSPFSHAPRLKKSIENLRRVFKIVTPYFVHIPAYGCVWGFAVASDSLDIANISAAEVNSRITQRNIQHRQFYNGEMHRAMQALPEYVRALIQGSAD